MELVETKVIELHVLANDPETHFYVPGQGVRLEVEDGVALVTREQGEGLEHGHCNVLFEVIVVMTVNRVRVH